MPGLPMSSQHAAEARFASNIDAFVSQHWNDPRRRDLRKSRLIGDLQNPLALLLAQGMTWDGSLSLWPPIPTVQSSSASALKRTSIYPGQLARRFQPCTLAPRL